MNRLNERFRKLKANGKKAFIAYIAAGDPDLKTTGNLVQEFEERGVDMVELGVPFSDPIADGPIIQRASNRALKNKVNIPSIFRLVRSLRKRDRVEIPILLMTYYNPVYIYGIERFVKDASQAGVDGVIIPDLPPEEGQEVIGVSRRFRFSTIFLLAPTSTPRRRRLIIKNSTGFIYYISLTGITGAKIKLFRELARGVKAVKSRTDKPVCVGFGISAPQEAANIARLCDGVIVGSAIIKVIEENFKNPHLVKKVGRFVSRLKREL